jgi:hypothetical protein
MRRTERTMRRTERTMRRTERTMRRTEGTMPRSERTMRRTERTMRRTASSTRRHSRICRIGAFAVRAHTPHDAPPAAPLFPTRSRPRRVPPPLRGPQLDRRRRAPRSARPRRCDPARRGLPRFLPALERRPHPVCRRPPAEVRRLVPSRCTPGPRRLLQLPPARVHGCLRPVRRGQRVRPYLRLPPAQPHGLRLPGAGGSECLFRSPPVHPSGRLLAWRVHDRLRRRSSLLPPPLGFRVRHSPPGPALQRQARGRGSQGIARCVRGVRDDLVSDPGGRVRPGMRGLRHPLHVRRRSARWRGRARRSRGMPRAILRRRVQLLTPRRVDRAPFAVRQHKDRATLVSLQEP